MHSVRLRERGCRRPGNPAAGRLTRRVTIGRVLQDAMKPARRGGPGAGRPEDAPGQDAGSPAAGGTVRLMSRW